MIDTRWLSTQVYEDIHVIRSSEPKGHEIYPSRIVHADLASDEVCLMAWMPNGMWEAYMKWHTLRLMCRWFGYITPMGPVGCIAYYFIPPGEIEPLDITEVWPDPLEFAFCDLYVEMSTYSHLHVLVLDESGSVKKWFEVPNDLRFDKMVMDIEALGTGWEVSDYHSARQAVLALPNPKQVLDSMLPQSPLSPMTVFNIELVGE